MGDAIRNDKMVSTNMYIVNGLTNNKYDHISTSVCDPQKTSNDKMVSTNMCMGKQTTNMFTSAKACDPQKDNDKMAHIYTNKHLAFIHPKYKFPSLSILWCSFLMFLFSGMKLTQEGLLACALWKSQGGNGSACVVCCLQWCILEAMFREPALLISRLQMFLFVQMKDCLYALSWSLRIKWALKG